MNNSRENQTTIYTCGKKPCYILKHKKLGLKIFKNTDVALKQIVAGVPGHALSIAYSACC